MIVKDIINSALLTWQLVRSTLELALLKLQGFLRRPFRLQKKPADRNAKRASALAVRAFPIVAAYDSWSGLLQWRRGHIWLVPKGFFHGWSPRPTVLYDIPIMEVKPEHPLLYDDLSLCLKESVYRSLTIR